MHQTPTTFEVDGSAIRDKRMQAGLSTAEAAERAGISGRYLNHLENGTRRRMRPERYAPLRKALNANPTELLALPRSATPKE